MIGCSFDCNKSGSKFDRGLLWPHTTKFDWWHTDVDKTMHYQMINYGKIDTIQFWCRNCGFLLLLDMWVDWNWILLINKNTTCTVSQMNQILSSIHEHQKDSLTAMTFSLNNYDLQSYSYFADILAEFPNLDTV